MKMLALGLLMVLGASAQKVTFESDPAVNFSLFKTFTLVQGRLNSRSPALNGELVRKRLDFDVQKYLAARKLTYVPSFPADLTVQYTLGAANRTEVEAYPAGWYGWGTRWVRVPYTEGTLVIDVRNAATRSLVWRSVARLDKRDPSKIEGKLDDMVRKSFDKYPPKK
jgi:Domain of unknown function (DUF4136)